MTIKDLYEWAEKNKIEDLKVVVFGENGLLTDASEAGVVPVPETGGKAVVIR